MDHETVDRSAVLSERQNVAKRCGANCNDHPHHYVAVMELGSLIHLLRSHTSKSLVSSYFWD
jgi:hypothetical protein